MALLVAHAQVIPAATTSKDPLVQELVEESKAINVPAEVVDQIAQNPEQCEMLMAGFMLADNGTPHVRAVRAVALAHALRRDARVKGDDALEQRLTDCLFRTIALTLCSPRFEAAQIGDGYIPAPSTFPYDFGGIVSQVAEGFSLVTPQSESLAGAGNPIDREGIGTGAILFDAISGLGRIVVQVPNGRYILILMTAQGGAGQTFKLNVNGVDYIVAWSPQAQWPVTTGLQATGVRTSKTPVGGLAGVLSMPIVVANGRCSINFTGLPSEFPLAAMELRQDDDVGEALYREEDCRRLEDATYLAAIEDPDRPGPPDPPPQGCPIPGTCVIEVPPPGSPMGP